MSLDTLGVKHLSPSSLAKWQNERGAWVAHYLYNLKSEAGPQMWRGTGVEGGFQQLLAGYPLDAAKTSAMNVFELEAQGDLDDAVEKERADIPAYVEQGAEAIKELNLPRPNGAQLRLEAWVDGVPVPVVGYPDFVFDGYCLDLKTTLRCPSDIRPDHMLQIAFYAHSRGETRADILYLTPKKWAHYTMDAQRIDYAVNEIKRRAKALETTAKAAVALAGEGGNPRAIMASMCAPDFSSFYWSDQAAREAVAAIGEWQ